MSEQVTMSEERRKVLEQYGSEMYRQLGCVVPEQACRDLAFRIHGAMDSYAQQRDAVWLDHASRYGARPPSQGAQGFAGPDAVVAFTIHEVAKRGGNEALRVLEARVDELESEAGRLQAALDEKRDIDTWTEAQERKAEIGRLRAEVQRLTENQSLMQDDLAALLRALGMGDHARPQSPHEVMLKAIEMVSGLRAERDALKEEVAWHWERRTALVREREGLALSIGEELADLQSTHNANLHTLAALRAAIERKDAALREVPKLVEDAMNMWCHYCADVGEFEPQGSCDNKPSCGDRMQAIYATKDRLLAALSPSEQPATARCAVDPSVEAPANIIGCPGMTCGCDPCEAARKRPAPEIGRRAEQAPETVVSLFDVMKEMSRGDLDIHLGDLSNVTRVQKVKKGTLITIGWPGDVVAAITTGAFVGGLILMDTKQYSEVTKRLRGALSPAPALKPQRAPRSR